MEIKDHKLYGCGGCGAPHVHMPPPVKNCDGCIVAPTIRFACDQGPDPGDTITYNIPEETNISLPLGHNYKYELYDYDDQGIFSVTITQNGVITIKTKEVYTHRREYRVRYRIVQIDGIQSQTGEIYICMKNQCRQCLTGVCDPIKGDCAVMPTMDIEVDCNSTYSISIPNWDVAEVYFKQKPDCVNTMAWNNTSKLLTGSTSNAGCEIGKKHEIQVEGKKGHAVIKGYLYFTIKDKSIGVICDENFIVDKCTGNCIAIQGGISTIGQIGKPTTGGLTTV